jgi:diacylglycerol kinase family enzyme
VLRDPGDLVVAAGGDGSVRSIGQALMGRRVPMTILPMGTANNVATHLGLVGHPESLIRQWSRWRPRSFDVGTVDGPWGSHVFFEACGFGTVARTMAALTPVEAPAAEDGTSEDELTRDLEVTREMLADHPSHQVALMVDGVAHAGAFIVVEAMNIRSLGPNIVLAPDADAGDGLLDLVLVDEDGRRRLREYLTTRMEAVEAGRRDEPRVSLPIQRARQVRVRWSGSRVHIDDQIVPDEDAASSGRYWSEGVCELTIGVTPAAMTVLAPD